jgi:hypothetical protein
MQAGPFTIHVTQQEGWRRFALVVDGAEIEAWASNPGVGYCKDALHRAIAQGRIDPMRAVALLLDTSLKPVSQWTHSETESQPMMLE